MRQHRYNQEILESLSILYQVVVDAQSKETANRKRSILLHPQFEKWFKGIQDKHHSKRIKDYLRRVAEGGAEHNIKTLTSVQDICEIRIDSIDMRLYCLKNFDSVIVLGGGNKKNQYFDIKKAEQVRESMLQR